MKPNLIVVAGPNGSGKTTITEKLETGFLPIGTYGLGIFFTFGSLTNFLSKVTIS